MKLVSEAHIYHAFTVETDPTFPLLSKSNWQSIQTLLLQFVPSDSCSFRTVALPSVE